RTRAFHSRTGPDRTARKKANTFTVVPKRRAESDGLPASPEPPQEPSGELGTLLKKRYPAVEEIEVIGGYLSLEKSCLTKTGSTGKKLKISFNESSLQSTYEYPSESSVWDSGEEDEDDKPLVARPGTTAECRLDADPSLLRPQICPTTFPSTRWTSAPGRS
uniref:Phostensin/Taperin PP1-binding domain-containing protein n=1 Tax=Salarias fasciatus TaxID=181472 RepID=A0A672JL08_SALFA